ncbi:hypothetical protein [Pasteurella testudinis]|uniref:hypothetical protein n=1 Tax=Pasteurella testudinis TaxID=761 RepID=UPI00405A36ED
MTQQIQEKPFPVPVSYFSITLGLFSIGLAWQHAEALFHAFPAFVSPVILSLAGVAWLALLSVNGL